MTHNAVLTIAGNWTMSNTHTIAGTSGITLSATGTITSNGQTWPNNITLGASATYTLASNFTCSGTTVQSSFVNPILNKTTSETWSTNGLSVPGNTNNTLSGTAEIILTGGTWSGNNTNIFTNLTFAGNVTVSGNVYYGTNTLKYTSGTITTTGSSLYIQASCTLNTSGINWNNVQLNSSATITLTSNFVATGTTSQSLTINPTINRTTTETWSTNGISLPGNTGNALSGTAEIILTGGTWSGNNTSIRNNLSFAGNVTVSSNVYYGTGILKYTSGTVTTTGSTLNITGTCTLNANGITWNNVLCSLGIITLTSNFTCTGTTTIANNITINKSTSETWSSNGLTMSSGRLDGNGEVVLTGGTWTCGANIIVYNPLTFAGNVTVSGTVNYRRNTLKYTSGTVTTTGSTLSVAGESIVFDTNGINWDNVIIGVNVTVNSLLNVTNTLTLTANTNISFSGTSGWTCATLLNASTGSATITLKDGNTYTVNTLFDCYQSRVGAVVLFTSSSATLKAILTLVNGASCKCLANFTRIDARAGRTINTFGGTITSSDNIRQFYDLATVSYSI
jgi:hypothetical protein